MEKDALNEEILFVQSGFKREEFCCFKSWIVKMSFIVRFTFFDSCFPQCTASQNIVLSTNIVKVRNKVAKRKELFGNLFSSVFLDVAAFFCKTSQSCKIATVCLFLSVSF